MRTNRVIGSLMGAAAGNCAGTPFIFMKSKDLRPRSRDIGWRIERPGIDLELAMASLCAISKRGINFDRIAEQYSRAIRSTDAEPDIVSTQCFGNECGEAASAHDRAIEGEFGPLCSNALLIRQLPITYAGECRDAAALNRLIAEDSLLTHLDEETIECAQLYAQTLYAVINGKNRVEVWDMLFETVQYYSNHNLLVRSYYEKPRCDASNYNDVRVSLQIALYHYWHQTPFAAAVRDTVLSGGATDTNASAVGALLGASQGIYAIPTAWRNELQPAPDEGPASWRIRFAAALQQVQKLTRHPIILNPSRTPKRMPSKNTSRMVRYR